MCVLLLNYYSINYPITSYIIFSPCLCHAIYYLLLLLTIGIGGGRTWQDIVTSAAGSKLNTTFTPTPTTPSVAAYVFPFEQTVPSASAHITRLLSAPFPAPACAARWFISAFPAAAPVRTVWTWYGLGRSVLDVCVATCK